MKKILLIGSKGQLGQDIALIIPKLGQLISLGRAELDLTYPDQIRQTISAIKPNLIINAAAYTAVDKAETEIELAQLINTTAPKTIAEEAVKIGASLIHVSTDYVFDGTKNTPYTEEDTTNPQSSYGKSKLEGENAIKNTAVNYIIVRTAWVYGVYGKQNFVKTMLRLGSQKEELKIVTDQVGTPTWTKDIAEAITVLSKLSLENSPKVARQTYHFTNTGVTSWYDLAVNIFDLAHKIGFPLKIKNIYPIKTEEYPLPAKRPAYSALSYRKIVEVLQFYPPYWRHSLAKMLEELYQKQI